MYLIGLVPGVHNNVSVFLTMTKDQLEFIVQLWNVQELFEPLLQN